MSQDPPEDLEANVRYLLDRCPHAIRCCEGGGPESLAGSVALTVLRMERMIAQRTPAPDQSKPADPSSVVYDDAHQSAVMSLLERGAVTQNSEGYLVTVDQALAETAELRRLRDEVVPDLQREIRALQEDVSAWREDAARRLYETWTANPGWKPWETGGDSPLQCEARRMTAIGVRA